MSTLEPSKSDVDAILKRLRSASANKCCFDCGAKNPTWSSITYGIFICIDCSATHRSLGVHISFVKSTQLDTNWTWIQLRTMQMGGNANAQAFFEQQNCLSKDSQQKYNSRAAQLYREKLHQLAIKAQRTHGTKLHLTDDASHASQSKPAADAEDFFSAESTLNEGKKTPVMVAVVEPTIDDKSSEGPSVSSAFVNPEMDEYGVSSGVKSNILAKKAAPPKRKGLGAQKVNADFKEIERVMLEQERTKELESIQLAKNKEEKERDMEKQMASMKLAYNNLDKQREKEEAKLLQTDPKKAQQLERLGMAVGNRGTGITHSALNDMQIIQQEGVSRGGNYHSSNQSSNSSGFSKGRGDFFDEMESQFSYNSKSSSSSRNDPYGGSGGNNRDNDDDNSGSQKGFGFPKKNSDWVIVDNNNDDPFTSNGGSNQGPSVLSMDNDFSRSKQQLSSKNSTGNSNFSSANNGDATKRFANAKSISSAQYFNNNSADGETHQDKLNKFQGSNSISSEDYFGDGNSSRKKNNYSSSSMAPDMSFIKQDLRESVTKVAGRLSNMANNVMSTFQDH